MKRALPIVATVLLMASCGSSHDRDRSDGGRTDAGARRDSGSTDAGPGLPDGGSSVCAHGTDCVLTPASCCGACGAYTRDDILSVHADDLGAARTAACVGGTDCPGCYMAPDPALIPVCGGEGACSHMDLYDPLTDHRSPFTACETDEDCRLRVTTCCECGAEVALNTLVAIRADSVADFEDMVCDPEEGGCDDCVPDYGPFFTWCGSDSPAMPPRCRVDVVGP